MNDTYTCPLCGLKSDDRIPVCPRCDSNMDPEPDWYYGLDMFEQLMYSDGHPFCDTCHVPLEPQEERYQEWDNLKGVVCYIERYYKCPVCGDVYEEG